MDDIQAFLNWYFSPRSKIGRAGFNIVVFLVFIPPLFLQFLGFGNTLGALSEGASGQDLSSLMTMMDTMMGGKGAAAGIPWVEWLNALIFLALLPLIQMRLRDAGMAAWWVYVFIALVAGDLGHLLLGVGWPWALGLALQIISFIVLLRLCIAPRYRKTMETEFKASLPHWAKDKDKR